MNFVIEGGNTLYGEVKISPAKNSALLIACASVLVGGEVFIKDCPNIGDIENMTDILTSLGASVIKSADGLYINTKNLHKYKVPKAPSSRIRASFFLVGALLSRFKKAVVYKPGGCKIGERSVDIHIDGFKRMGVSVFEDEEKYVFSAKPLTGAKITLRYPSVGATENLVLSGVFADGITEIENAAQEPEVKDLCDFLNFCGADITGGGSGRIKIKGVKKLHGGVVWKPIPDRVETATFLMACYLLKGKVTISQIKSENICILMKKIRNITCNNRGFYANIYREKIYIQSDGAPKGLGSFVTAPYPKFPTDMHPLVSAVGASADGVTRVRETVFENRFGYLDGLKKMGADFTLNGNLVTFNGKPLHGETVTSPDLRGGACYVLAGLKAEGVTTVTNAEIIARGYDGLDVKLKSLGAKIKKT